MREEEARVPWVFPFLFIYEERATAAGVCFGYYVRNGVVTL